MLCCVRSVVEIIVKLFLASLPVEEIFSGAGQDYRFL
jgi:hypothetical protein